MKTAIAKGLTVFVFCLALLACNNEDHAPPLSVAVASNFRATAMELAHAFRQQSGVEVRLSTGSTGKHYTQIINGAPFDVFLAADSQRPSLLEGKELIQPNSRMTYAIGQLVLWSPDVRLITDNGVPNQGFAHLAIANPELAPYGLATQQTLQKLGLWDGMKGTMVRGENIAQVMQFLSSGNAQLGFVSAAQLIELGDQGSRWNVPSDLHDPIEQQAVQLSNHESAAAFMRFLVGKSAREIIARNGYLLP